MEYKDLYKIVVSGRRASDVFSEKARKLFQDAQVELDFANQIWTESVEEVSNKLDKEPIETEGQQYRGLVLNLSPDYLLIAVGGDNLVMVEGEEEHHFGPANSRGHRQCNIPNCPRVISWPVVNLAPLGNPKDVPVS